jgi:hypothetical protein
MKWQIGKVTVTKIVEMEVTGGSRFLLPQATHDEILPIKWLQPHFADERGRLKMSIHALVVETPERRIVVDTWSRPSRWWKNGLAKRWPKVRPPWVEVSRDRRRSAAV